MKTIIYLVLGIIWFIFKNRKKNAKKKTPTPQPTYQEYEEIEPPQQNQPKGFEELFEQILGEAPKKEVEAIQPQVVIKPVPERKKKVKIESHSNDEKLEFERYDGFKIKEERGEDYSMLFESQESTEEAFIASEIFARKY